MNARVLIVQYAGDFRDAATRLEAGGEETYYAQRYSIDSVRALVADGADEVATLCCTAEAHDTVVFPGVRSIGGGMAPALDDRLLIEIVAAYKPTLLILRTPLNVLLRWAIGAKVRTLLTLADSFRGSGLRHRWRQRRIAALFNTPTIEFVANHGWTATRDLLRLGVRPGKVLPWDWPHTTTPDEQPPKTAIGRGSRPLELLFVGIVAESKGVGDAIDAVMLLQAAGIAAHLSIAGKGDVDLFRDRAERLGVRDAVRFLGMVPNAQIVTAMHAADIVLVTSRHDYPEGFPMTIYEALCSRTPIVASDHPMFADFLRDGVSALVYPAGDAAALAATVRRLAADTALQDRLSLAASSTWGALQSPIQWGDLIRRWVRDEPTAFAAWVASTGVRDRLAAAGTASTPLRTT